MNFEHFALNVPDARAHAQWYVQHLGFTIVRQRPDAPYTHFLADTTGRTGLTRRGAPGQAVTRRPGGSGRAQRTR